MPINKTILSFLFFLLAYTQGYSGNATIDSLAVEKAKFIIEVANNIDYQSANKNKVYKIGVFGKSNEVKALFDELNKRSIDEKISGKSLIILNFRKTKHIQPVDLMYVGGESKIRISDLNKQLAEKQYIIVTENFPFGTSLLNFAVNKNNEIFFEIHDDAITKRGASINKSLLNSANRTFSEKEWEKRLISAQQIVREHKEVIVVQNKEIIAQDEVIDHQLKFILIGILVTLIITTLSIFLWRINIQRKNALHQLELKTNEIISSITYAKRIQANLLPPKENIKRYFNEYFIMYQPKDIVAGDFYWLEYINNKIYITIADCTGHGVSGAILSVLCSNALSKVVKELNISEPDKILDKTSEIIENHFSDSEISNMAGMDLALCCIDFSNNTLEYAGANNPLTYIRNNELHTLEPNRQPVGRYDYKEPFTNHKIAIEKGDCFYLKTDGYTDQFGGQKNKKLSIKRFNNVILENHNKPMEQQLQILNDTLVDWMGENKQIDDICMMGFRV